MQVPELLFKGIASGIRLRSYKEYNYYSGNLNYIKKAKIEKEVKKDETLPLIARNKEISQREITFLKSNRQ